MRAKEVRIGTTYVVKVSGIHVPVRIENVDVLGGWVGTNMTTGRRIRVRSGKRLRGEWPTKKRSGPPAY